jgi:hypothetical protein
MALNTTTTTAAIAASDLYIPVASVTGVSVGRKVRINNEFIGAVIGYVGLIVQVRSRGAEGTRASAHGVSSPITFGDGTDFTTPTEARDSIVPAVLPAQVFMNADAAIVVPDKDTTIVFTKGSALLSTLPAPSAAQDGVRLTILSGSAFAHVITATTLLQDGVTGGAKTTATFAAFVGASLVLQALKGTWQVVGKNVVTIT